MNDSGNNQSTDSLLAKALQAIHEAIGLGDHSADIDAAVQALSGQPAEPVGGEANAEPEAPVDVQADVPAEQPPPVAPGEGEAQPEAPADTSTTPPPAHPTENG